MCDYLEFCYTPPKCVTFKASVRNEIKRYLCSGQNMLINEYIQIWTASLTILRRSPNKTLFNVSVSAAIGPLQRQTRAHVQIFKLTDPEKRMKKTVLRRK